MENGAAAVVGGVKYSAPSAAFTYQTNAGWSGSVCASAARAVKTSEMRAWS